MLKIVENLWAVGGLGSSKHSPDQLPGGETVDAPPQEPPPPLSAFGRSVLAPMKNPGSGNALEFCGHFGGHLDHDADPGIFKAIFFTIAE